jgi:hypothetical protein
MPHCKEKSVGGRVLTVCSHCAMQHRVEKNTHCEPSPVTASLWPVTAAVVGLATSKCEQVEVTLRVRAVYRPAGFVSERAQSAAASRP